MMERTVAWFSCGAASAVAAKMTPEAERGRIDMSIRVLPNSGRTVIRCHTEGRSGREYDVTLDREGLVVSVVNVSMYGNMRTTWHFASDKPMGLTAKCAVRAARRKLREAPTCPKCGATRDDTCSSERDCPFNPVEHGWR